MKSKVVRSAVTGTAVLLAIAGVSNVGTVAVAKPVAPTASTAAEFQPFWARFRTAILARDMAAIEAMTSFPLKAKGDLDDQPVKTISRTTFPPMLAAILKEDASVRGFQGTTQDFIRSNAVFPVDKLNGGGRQRVGDLVFQQGAGGWKLAMIYQPDP